MFFFLFVMSFPLVCCFSFSDSCFFFSWTLDAFPYDGFSPDWMVAPAMIPFALYLFFGWHEYQSFQEQVFPFVRVGSSYMLLQ